MAVRVEVFRSAKKDDEWSPSPLYSVQGWLLSLVPRPGRR